MTEVSIISMLDKVIYRLYLKNGFTIFEILVAARQLKGYSINVPYEEEAYPYLRQWDMVQRQRSPARCAAQCGCWWAT